MKKFLALSAAAFLLGVIAHGITSGPEAESPRDGLLLHVSHGHDDPHRFLMALNMANMMADDHDVLVYFDITAVKALLKDSEEMTLSPFPSRKDALASLKAKKVTLMACPGCLKAAGKSPADLEEGIQIADKKAFFSFTKGRIVTLDY